MKIELLAPAGNFESLIAAIESGADAVYIGGTKYSARASADNFNEEEIKEAVRYAHIRNVKIYVTINILLTDEELVDALEYVQFLYNNDIDGIIVQDIGLLYLIKKCFPDMPVHCSTQMTIHNKDGVDILSRLGADRFVLAREMSIREVKNLVADTNAETEIFIHGALCVCYSGQCLMSSFIGGRSGNRGKCAQPCRKKYILVNLDDSRDLEYHRKGYLLSPKDLNTIEYIGEIIKSGVKSLKIEGRMKKPEYVAIVVKHYKDALDQVERQYNSNIDESVQRELESAFNRGFTRGFLFNEKKSEFVNSEKPNNKGVFIGKILWQKGNRTAISLEKGSLDKGDGIEITFEDGTSVGTYISTYEKYSNNSLVTSISHKLYPGLPVYKTYDKHLYDKAHYEYYYKNRRKVFLNGELFIHIGKRLYFKIWDNEGHIIEYESQYISEKAKNTAITEERIINQLKKTGDTPYLFDKILIHADDNIFVSMSAINELRRESLKKTDRILSNRNKREYRSLRNEDFLTNFEPDKSSDRNSICFGASVWNYENISAAIEAGIDYIYYGACEKVKEAVELCHRNNIEIYFLLPNIIKDAERERFTQIIKENSFDGIVISNISQLSYVNIKPDIKIIGNYNLNVFNKRCMDIYLKLGVHKICPSLELNLKQLKSIAHNYGTSMELVVYGQIPLMTMEYCPLSSSGGCKGCKNQKSFGLKDEKGAVFPLFCNNHRMQLLNSSILFVVEEMEKILATGVKRVRLDFYKESKTEVKEIIELYRNYKNLSKESYFDTIKRVKSTGHTKGHYFRGVD
ncbi:DUF3656 domain-containing U32 family peptidase [Lutispora thermophila]|nr:U32 family peptidase [Lutispora thermophila]